jgi:DNA-binding CsgD family transcriptional regulator
MDDLTVTQLRRALRAAHELTELRELTEFPGCVARTLHELIPCEHAGYNAIDVPSGRATIVADPPDSVFDGGPEVLVEFGHQSPLIVQAAAGATDVLLLSDHISRRALHRTDLYELVYRVIAVEYQLGVALPPLNSRPGRPAGFVGLSLSRTHRDFGEGDRALLSVLQPFLTATLDRLHELALLHAVASTESQASSAAVVLVDADGTVAWASMTAAERLGVHVGARLPDALRHWLATERRRQRGGAAVQRLDVAGQIVRPRLVLDAYPNLDAIHLMLPSPTPSPETLRALGLTRRQSEVLALAVEGHSCRQIGERLQLSTRTVEKHLEAIYGQFGVHNRGQAIRTTFERLAA